MNEYRKNAGWITILTHALAWCIFLFLPYLFSLVSGGLFFSTILYTIKINSLFFIVTFYTGYFFIVPRAYEKKSYLMLLLWYCLSIAVLTLINSSIILPGSNRWFILSTLFPYFLMLLLVHISAVTLLLFRRLRNSEQETLKTEVSFLRSQINPHFLFNMLNSIYSLTIIKSDDAPSAVVRLSALMRYLTTDITQHTVPLSKELDYINNYISLQQLRLTEKVKLSFEMQGQAEGKQIVPFVLIPFIENAFKYGVNSEEDSRIDISIFVDNNELNLYVSNNKIFVERSQVQNFGLGIKSTRQRLQHFYPMHHELDITNNDSVFSVSLKLRLK